MKISIKSSCLVIALLIVWSIMPSQAQGQNTNKRSLIGTIYNADYPDGLFEGWKDVGGFMLVPLNGTKYGVHRYKKGDNHLFILQKFISSNETGGNSVWKIVDTLTVPSVSGGKIAEMCICTKNGKRTEESMIALTSAPTSADYKRGYYTIIRVWQANRRLSRFVAVTKEGVKSAIVGSGD